MIDIETSINTAGLMRSSEGFPDEQTGEEDEYTLDSIIPMTKCLKKS